MRVISRMIARRVAGRSFVVFSFVGVIILTTQVLNQASKLIEASTSLWLVAQLLALFVPTIAVVILPVAFLIAVIQTYDGMDENLEAAVVQASGAGPWTLLAPTVLMGAGVAAIVLLTSLFIEPAANRSVRDLLGAVQLDAIQIIATDGVLREVEPGLFVRGGARSGDGQIKGIFILDRRRASGEILYVAERGQLVREQGRIRLEIFNGTLLVRNRAGEEEQRVSFGKYITEPESLFGAVETKFGARHASTVDLLQQLGAEKAPRARSELVRRATDWLYPLVFVALAALLTSRAVPSRQAVFRRWRLPLAVLIGGGLRVLGLALVGPAGQSTVALGAAFAVPLGGALIFGVAAGLRASASGGSGFRARGARA
jgi:lipopolysaccharide export system permease protein